MKFSRQKLSPALLRIVLTFSLVFAVGWAWGGTYSDLHAKLSGSPSASQALKLIEPFRKQDASLDEIGNQLESKSQFSQKIGLDSLRSYVAVRAQAESFGTDSLAKSQAAEIKASPLYRDEPAEASNWFGKAAKNIIDGIVAFFKRLFQGRSDENRMNGMHMPGLFGVWIVYVVWAILLALVATFAFFAIRQARWQTNLKRKAKAMLEEDEPERTLDEWLERAKLLESQGQFREAVRCLYLACLLKFDEARIARFDRGQTNWEHLHRIEASPKLPRDVEFRPATEAFDHIWYGMVTRGQADVDQFREWYLDLGQKLMMRAA